MLISITSLYKTFGTKETCVIQHLRKSMLYFSSYAM